MPFTELLLEGLRLMVIGMGIVFAFLLLLVFVLRLMSKMALRVAPEAPVSSLRPAGMAQEQPPPESNSELVAVISAAIARYRNNRPHV
jgi:oxaloacetate decarboxylase gamma subunit